MQSFNKTGDFEDLKHPGRDRYYLRRLTTQQILNQNKQPINKKLEVLRWNQTYDHLDGFSHQILI